MSGARGTRAAPAPKRGELEALIARIIDRINENPEKAAVVLAEWIRVQPARQASSRPLKKTG
jgi:hypothetical protein